MQAVAHSKKFSKEAGVPQGVGKEFNNEDKKKSKSERLYKKKDK